jgi:hypothetical protein
VGFLEDGFAAGGEPEDHPPTVGGVVGTSEESSAHEVVDELGGGGEAESEVFGGGGEVGAFMFMDEHKGAKLPDGEFGVGNFVNDIVDGAHDEGDGVEEEAGALVGGGVIGGGLGAVFCVEMAFGGGVEVGVVSLVRMRGVGGFFAGAQGFSGGVGNS